MNLGPKITIMTDLGNLRGIPKWVIFHSFQPKRGAKGVPGRPCILDPVPKSIIN